MRFRKLKAMGPVNNFFVTMSGLFINAAAYDVALVALGSLEKVFELFVNPKDMPDDMAINYLQWHIVKDWKRHLPEEEHCPYVIYIDWWPLSMSYVLVTDPVGASQCLQSPRHPRSLLTRTLCMPSLAI